MRFQCLFLLKFKFWIIQNFCNSKVDLFTEFQIIGIHCTALYVNFKCESGCEKCGLIKMKTNYKEGKVTYIFVELLCVSPWV